MPFNIFNILGDLMGLLLLLIMVSVVISWAIVLGARGVSPYHPWVRTLNRITDPVLNPFRMLVPPSKLNGLDISPFLAYLAIQLIQSLFYQLGRAPIR